MALPFNKYFKPIPSGYKVLGAGPIDLRQVVNTLDDLYGSNAQETHTWDIDGDIIAYNGMLVAVTSIKKIYMCIDYLHPYLEASWECLTHYTEIDASLNVMQNEIIDISINRVSSLDGSVGNYITVLTDASKGDVQVSATLSIGDISNNIDGLVTVHDVKKYIDDVSVQYTLDSVTPEYVQATSSVDSSGRIISSSVGVIAITLEDASNGSTGLAIAQNVYEKLTEVEEVTAAATTTIAGTLGLEDNFGVSWSASSGIPAAATYKEAIEMVQTELQWITI